MSNTKNHTIWRDVAVGIISGVGVIVVTTLLALALPPVKVFLLARVPVPVGVLIFLAIGAVVWIVLDVRQWILSHSAPEWLHYRQDVVEGVPWVWRYDAQREITDLSAKCLRHKRELVPSVTLGSDSMWWTHLHCVECRRQYQPLPGSFEEITARVLSELRRRRDLPGWHDAPKRIEEAAAQIAP